MPKTAQKPKYEPPESDLYPDLIEFPSDDAGAEEAASFIAETVNELARLAQRHKLDLLCYLLSMTQLEADEFVRSCGKRKPS